MNALANELPGHDRAILVRAVGTAFKLAGEFDWAPFWRELSDLGRHVLVKRDAREILDCALDLWARAPESKFKRGLRAVSVGALDLSTREEIARRIDAAQLRERADSAGGSRVIEAETA